MRHEKVQYITCLLLIQLPFQRQKVVMITLTLNTYCSQKKTNLWTVHKKRDFTEYLQYSAKMATNITPYLLGFLHGWVSFHDSLQSHIGASARRTSLSLTLLILLLRWLSWRGTLTGTCHHFGNHNTANTWGKAHQKLISSHSYVTHQFIEVCVSWSATHYGHPVG